VSVANHLVKFFDAEAADVTVKPEKAKIRAKIFVEGEMSDLRIRMYQEDERTAIEFQRKSGCALVFSRVYRDASRWIQKKYSTVLEPMLDDPDYFIPEAPKFDCPMDENPDHFIDMCIDDLAGRDESYVQKEALQHLTQVIQNGSLHHILKRDEALTNLVGPCLKSESLEVAFSTNALLSSLLHEVKNGASDVNYTISSALVDSMKTSTSSFVIRELSSTLTMACRNNSFDANQSKELSESIAVVLDSANAVESFSVKSNLEESLFSLRSGEPPMALPFVA
jgi:hypothetical protein